MIWNDQRPNTHPIVQSLVIQRKARVTLAYFIPTELLLLLILLDHIHTR